MVRMALTKGERGEEINPIYWDDNYITLFPGETKEVKVRFEKRDTGETPVILKVSGWNIKQ